MPRPPVAIPIGLPTRVELGGKSIASLRTNGTAKSVLKVMEEQRAFGATGRRRKSTRLRKHDYSENGCYFITLCCKRRQPLLSRVIGGNVETTAAGEALELCWLGCARRWDCQLDSHIVMPDHFHGILRLLPTAKAGRTLGMVISGVKSAAARAINEIRRAPGASVFQRGYYEHVVRDEPDLVRIRAYIAANPTRWHEGEEDCDRFDGRP